MRDVVTYRCTDGKLDMLIDYFTIPTEAESQLSRLRQSKNSSWGLNFYKLDSLNTSVYNISRPARCYRNRAMPSRGCGATISRAQTPTTAPESENTNPYPCTSIRMGTAVGGALPLRVSMVVLQRSFTALAADRRFCLLLSPNKSFVSPDLHLEGAIPRLSPD